MTFVIKIVKGKISIDNTQFSTTSDSVPQAFKASYDSATKQVIEHFRQLLQDKVNGCSILEVFNEDFMIPLYNLIPDSVPLEWLVNSSHKLSLYIKSKYALILYHVI